MNSTSAFPTDNNYTVGMAAQPGMTFLDYLAGQALVGLCASQWGGKEKPTAIDIEATAASSVALAQAVLRKLDCQQGRVQSVSEDAP